MAEDALYMPKPAPPLQALPLCFKTPVHDHLIYDAVISIVLNSLYLRKLMDIVPFAFPSTESNAARAAPGGSRLKAAAIQRTIQAITCVEQALHSTLHLGAFRCCVILGPSMMNARELIDIHVPMTSADCGTPVAWGCKQTQAVRRKVARALIEVLGQVKPRKPQKAWVCVQLPQRCMPEHLPDHCIVLRDAPRPVVRLPAPRRRQDGDATWRIYMSAGQAGPVDADAVSTSWLQCGPAIPASAGK